MCIEVWMLQIKFENCKEYVTRGHEEVLTNSVLFLNLNSIRLIHSMHTETRLYLQIYIFKYTFKYKI